jgi:hypothetical protein
MRSLRSGNMHSFQCPFSLHSHLSENMLFAHLPTWHSDRICLGKHSGRRSNFESQPRNFFPYSSNSNCNKIPKPRLVLWCVIKKEHSGESNDDFNVSLKNGMKWSGQWPVAQFMTFILIQT